MTHWKGGVEYWDSELERQWHNDPDKDAHYAYYVARGFTPPAEPVEVQQTPPDNGYHGRDQQTVPVEQAVVETRKPSPLVGALVGAALSVIINRANR